jgi:hypothetical protein
MSHKDFNKLVGKVESKVHDPHLKVAHDSKGTVTSISFGTHHLYEPHHQNNHWNKHADQTQHSRENQQKQTNNAEHKNGAGQNEKGNHQHQEERNRQPAHKTNGETEDNERRHPANGSHDTPANAEKPIADSNSEQFKGLLPGEKDGTTTTEKGTSGEVLTKTTWKDSTTRIEDRTKGNGTITKTENGRKTEVKYDKDGIQSIKTNERKDNENMDVETFTSKDQSKSYVDRKGANGFHQHLTLSNDGKFLHESIEEKGKEKKESDYKIDDIQAKAKSHELAINQKDDGTYELKEKSGKTLAQFKIWDLPKVNEMLDKGPQQPASG